MTVDRILALLEPIQNRLNAANLGPLDFTLSENRKWDLLLEHPGSEDERLVAKLVDDDEAVLFVYAPTDLLRMLTALEAVSATHQPKEIQCRCSLPKDNHVFCKACGDRWPCATVAAVVAALGGEA